ncbi:hypothetical protein Misp06_04333 [Microbulbifer sp. NBRC 101763]
MKFSPFNTLVLGIVLVTSVTTAVIPTEKLGHYREILETIFSIFPKDQSVEGG